MGRKQRTLKYLGHKTGTEEKNCWCCPWECQICPQCSGGKFVLGWGSFGDGNPEKIKILCGVCEGEGAVEVYDRSKPTMILHR